MLELQNLLAQFNNENEVQYCTNLLRLVILEIFYLLKVEKVTFLTYVLKKFQYYPECVLLSEKIAVKICKLFGVGWAPGKYMPKLNNAVGYYIPLFGTIVVQPINKESFTPVFLHELGHAVFHRHTDLEMIPMEIQAELFAWIMSNTLAEKRLRLHPRVIAANVICYAFRMHTKELGKADSSLEWVYDPVRMEKEFTLALNRNYIDKFQKSAFTILNESVKNRFWL
jgi:hypothetical protein